MTIENIAKKLVSWKKILLSQKKISLAVLFLFIAGVLLFVHPVLAQTTAAPAAASTFTGSSFANSILSLISLVMMKVAQTCLQLLMFVLTFVIQIAAYNGYLDSTAVNTGWILIRDLTNMVFVVALLAIAFGTILGIEHYEWKHMLFKLVSAAILVNFSRIICGILIDIAQVVMMTFINGIAATASGNLIRAFSLERIQSFANGTTGAQIDPVTVFITAMAAVFVSVTILVVMCVMLAMLIARMIVLWVLIVLSPVAFVLGILHQTEHYASEWWGEFGKNVITGPVLVFFIWLTLVTVGSGVAGQEIGQGSPGINKPQEINVGIADVLTGERLVNFAIAIGMLLVGLRITQHLGGIGAEWSGSAVSMGKKAAMAVSGVALARSAVQKGAELGKEAVKMPFVEAGRYTAARAKTFYAEKWANPRAEKAGERAKIANAKNADGTYVNPWLKRAGANFMASTNKLYRDKIIGSREKEAEATAGLAPHLLSTSSTDAGIAKRKAEEKLALYEHTGHDIDAEKEAKEKERQMRAMNIIHDAGKEPLSEEQLEALKKENFSEDEARKMFEREKRAIKSKSVGKQVGDIVSTHNEEMQNENEANLRSKVSWGDKSFNLDKNNREASIEKFKQTMDASGVPNAERAEMLKRFESGQEIRIGANVVELQDHTQQEFNAAKQKLAKAREGNLISPEQEKKAIENLEFQQKELELAHLSKVSGQMSREVGSQKGLTEAKTEKHLMHEESYKQREGRINELSNEMKQIEEKTATEKEINLLKQIAGLLAEGTDGKKRQLEIAELNSDKDTQKLESERQALLIRSEAAKNQNNIPLANMLEQQANSLLFNKIQEGMKASGANADERANLVKELAKKMKELNTAILNNPAVTDEQIEKKEKDSKSLDRLTKQQVGLMAINGQMTAFDAQESMRRGLQGVGWDEKWTNKNTTRRALSLMLGRKIEEKEEKKAVEELEGRFGSKEQMQVAMRQIGFASKNQTGQLNTDYMFMEQKAGEDGKTVWQIRTTDKAGNQLTEEKIAKDRLDLLEGWRRSGDARAGSAKQIPFGIRVVNDDENRLESLEENEAEAVASFYKNATAQTFANEKGGMIGDIESSLPGLEPDSLERIIRNFAKVVKNKDALKSLITRLGQKSVEDKIGKDELEKLLEKANDKEGLDEEESDDGIGTDE